jgi:programmed cell death 6-interacting protein
MNGNHKSRF